MSDLSGHRILVVDDDPDAREFIKTVLGDDGATIIEAQDGIEALAIARREKPDLVTLDINMPGKGGAQVYEEMREDSELQGVPVCIVSGQPELRKLIYQRVVPPPDGYLDKPINEDALLLVVKKLLAMSRRKSTEP
jgi:CheY-like chemotaxis protein